MLVSLKFMYGVMHLGMGCLCVNRNDAGTNLMNL